jgi:hypothetical protein
MAEMQPRDQDNLGDGQDPEHGYSPERGDPGDEMRQGAEEDASLGDAPDDIRRDGLLLPGTRFDG